jgi:hypothetical protein
MARTQDKKTAHWSSKGASIERAGKGWRKNGQKMREIDREEQIYGTRENSIREKKERTTRVIRDWAKAQHDEWQKTELDHINDREREHGETICRV